MLNFDNLHIVFFQYGKIDILQATWAMRWRVLEIKGEMEHYIIFGRRGVDVG
ncbi:MAG: hypothetical protein V3U84_07000 [Thiotrichaceae bacterium]